MPVGARILVVEDDADSRDSLSGILNLAGYEVTACGDGPTAIAAAQAVEFDLVLLDLLIPGADGFQILALMREEHGMPVIIISGLNDPAQKAYGLRLGADDYLGKPFDAQELLARIEARLRSAPVETVLTVGPLTVDLKQRQASLDGSPVTLTRRQFDLLAALCSQAGKVVSREDLLDRVWGTRFMSPRNVNEQVRLLRQRLEAGGGPVPRIEPVPGVGYRLRA